MFFMAREYHSFTVSVRVARLAGRNTPGRNNSGSLGEAVATPDLSYASAGFQPASRPCACDHKGRRRAGRALTRVAYHRRDGSRAGLSPDPSPRDFPPTSLRSTLGRAGQGGTGGDAG